MSSYVTAVIEVYEYEKDLTVSRLLERFDIKYNSEKYPTPESFGKHLIEMALNIAKTKKLKISIVIEVEKDSLAARNLRKKGIEVYQTFIVKTYKI